MRTNQYLAIGELSADFALPFARTQEPVPFGADTGGPTRLSFLLCAPDEVTRLHSLARLARLLDSITPPQLQREAALPQAAVREP